MEGEKITIEFPTSIMKSLAIIAKKEGYEDVKDFIVWSLMDYCIKKAIVEPVEKLEKPKTTA